MSRDTAVVEKLLLSLKSIGSFELEPLRQDAWGACFKAVDPNRRIAVSIKTLWPGDFSHEPAELMGALKAQAQAVQSLSHPNLAKAIGSGELDGAFFSVTTYIHGRSIREMLGSPERLNVWDLIDVARQVTLGLEYAHSHNVILRALHPGNLILEHDGATRIVDAGWYRANVPAAEPLAPSAFYLAPEQLEEAPADQQTNFYSLALVLYEIATGKQPFHGENWAEVIASAEEPIPPAIEVNPNIPVGISAALTRALSPRREDRFQSGNELVRALENYKAAEKPAPPKAEGVAAAVPTGIAGTPRPIPAPAPAPVRAFQPEKPKVDPKLDLESENRSRVPDVRPSLMSFQDVLEWNPPPRRPATPEEPFDPQEPPAWRVALNKIASATYRYGKDVVKKVDPWVFVLVSCSLLLIGFVARTVHRSFFSETNTAAIQQPAPTPVPSPTPQEAPQPVEVATPENVEVVPESVPVPAAPRGKSASGRRSRNAQPVLPIPANVLVANAGSLSITTVPPGAQVTIEGKPGQVFTTPGIIAQLAPGPHILRISKAGYQPASREVSISPGATSNIAVQLDTPPAYLTVTSNPPGAFIVVDGRNTTRVTPSEVPIAPGTHTLTIRLLGYLEENATVTIAPGEHQARSVSLLAAGSTPEIKVIGGRKLFGRNKISGTKISVSTQPAGARIAVNGQEVGKATPVEFSLNPGNYVLTISLDGYRPIRKVVNVQDGRPVAISESLQLQ